MCLTLQTHRQHRFSSAAFPPNTGSARASAASDPSAQTHPDGIPASLLVHTLTPGPAVQTHECMIHPKNYRLQQPLVWGIHQGPQILVVLLLQGPPCFTNHFGVVPPFSCSLSTAERGNSYSDCESCPKNHLHPVRQPLGSCCCSCQHAIAIPFPHP